MVADTAANAINFYAQHFGPYPYGTLRLTQMPGPMSQGWPGLIFLSSYSFLVPEELMRIERDPADFLLSKQVTAHETAHEWWGDLIYWRGYRDQWLFEGLANYCSLMMLERENPTGFRQVMTRYRDNLLARNKDGALLKDAGPVTLGLRLSSSEFPQGYEAISYGRGTWLFHMLRHILDDEPADVRKPQTDAQRSRFFQTLLKLREHYAGKPVTTREVLQVMAEELPPSQRYEGKKQLDWFLDGWVNGTAVPHLQLQNVKFTGTGRSLTASGIIVQKNAPKDLVTSVPLFAQLPGNRRVLAGRVFADGPEAAFRISVPVGTRKLLLDADDTVLRN
jgi:aminopeptidase N